MRNTRFSALGKTIDDFAAKLDDDVPQAGSIQALLKSLHVFGETLYDFFAQGFAQGRLEKSKSDPPEYVEDLILDKVARDLDAILAAYLLRVPLSINDGRGAGLGFTAKLGLTDALARAALKRAAQFNLPVNAAPLELGDERTLGATEILTYFDRSMQIRMIPYAPAVLISVPLSGLNRNLDLSAIAHETGHVVFRSGELVNSIAAFGLSDQQTQSRHFLPSVRARLLKLGSTVEDEDRWYYPWLEEIFADVYGCLVAGPYVARRFLEFSTAWRDEGFGKTGGSHPSPAVRPLVFSAALREIPQCFTVDGLDLEVVAGRLDTAWLAHLAERGVTQICLPKEERPISPGAASEKIQEAVREVLTVMIGEKPASAVANPSDPADPALEAIKPRLDDLPPWPALQSWQSALDEGQEPAYPSPAPGDAPQRVRKVLTKEQAEQLIADLLGEAGRRPGLITAADWNRVLTFGGWLDKGPEGGKAH